jgi:hypothetical protein
MRPRLLDPTPLEFRRPMARGTARILWLLTLLFAVRVAAQAMQRWRPQAFLPPFCDFQGSHLAYPLLLTAQLLILAAMLHCSWKVQRGTLSPRARAATVLWWCGGLYMAASLARLAIGLDFPAASPWFRAWISGVFHLVLAGFVLTVATFHQRLSGAGGSNDVGQ